MEHINLKVYLSSFSITVKKPRQFMKERVYLGLAYSFARLVHGHHEREHGIMRVGLAWSWSSSSSALTLWDNDRGSDKTQCSPLVLSPFDFVNPLAL